MPSGKLMSREEAVERMRVITETLPTIEENPKLRRKMLQEATDHRRKIRVIDEAAELGTLRRENGQLRDALRSAETQLDHVRADFKMTSKAKDGDRRYAERCAIAGWTLFCILIVGLIIQELAT